MSEFSIYFKSPFEKRVFGVCRDRSGGATWLWLYCRQCCVYLSFRYFRFSLLPFHFIRNSNSRRLCPIFCSSECMAPTLSPDVITLNSLNVSHVVFMHQLKQIDEEMKRKKTPSSTRPCKRQQKRETK